MKNSTQWLQEIEELYDNQKTGKTTPQPAPKIPMLEEGQGTGQSA